MHTADVDLRYQPSAFHQLAESTTDPPAFPVKLRLRVRCLHCELTQWEAETCRRSTRRCPPRIVKSLK